MSGQSITFGGSKGHEIETISKETNPYFFEMCASYQWKMIQNCTGRHTCNDHKKISSLSPLELLHQTITISNKTKEKPWKEYLFSSSQLSKQSDNKSTKKKDDIIVIPLDDKNETGLITYIKKECHENGHCTSIRYVHTLNLKSGFQRKLRALGVELS